MRQLEKLSEDGIAVFQQANPGWDRTDGALVKTFVFDSYAAGIAFVVRVGFLAERRDHHPDLAVGYRRVRVGWSTHDAGGITGLDTELARATDELGR